MRVLKRISSVRVKVLAMLIAASLFVGCGNDSDVLKVNYKTPIERTCKSDTVNRYHVGIPDTLIGNYPVIIILDSHGDGLKSVTKFEKSLTNVSALIVGSDLIKNGDNNFIQQIDVLLSDLGLMYSINNHPIVIAGFSGGARMAYYYGINNSKIAGIIMFGAGPGQKVNTIHKPMYVVSGMRDFNFIETFIPLFKTNKNVYFDYEHIGHEWPSSDVINSAVVFCLRNTYAKVQAQQLYHKSLKISDSLLQKADYYFAAKYLEKAKLLAISKDDKIATISLITKYRRNVNVKNSEDKLVSILQKEISLQSEYRKRLKSKDEQWWKNEIDNLNKLCNTSKDRFNQDFYYRVKGYIGIILYSYVKHEIKANLNSEFLTKLLAIYQYIEPKNPDMYYFKSIYEINDGNMSNGREFFNKSISLGYDIKQGVSSKIPKEWIK